MTIAAVSLALRDLAARACTGALEDDTIIIRQPPEVPFLQGDGVAVILLRADYDGSARNQPSNGGGPRDPVPLGLHYALVPYAMEALHQHRLLSMLIRATAAQPVLTADGLDGPVMVSIAAPDPAQNDPTAGWPVCLRLRVRGLVIGD